MQVVLIMFRADGERRSFSLPKDTTVIGRREDCDLRIPLAEVSRKHCKFTIDGDTLTVEDMGSSNGTYVNGERVQNAAVQAGDTVQVGPCIFIVQINGVPSDEEIQPAAPEAGVASTDDGATTQAPVTAADDDDDIPMPTKNEEDDMLDFVMEEVQEERKKKQA